MCYNNEGFKVNITIELVSLAVTLPCGVPDMTEVLLRRLADLQEHDSIENLGNGLFQHVECRKFKGRPAMLAQVRRLNPEQLSSVRRLGDGSYKVTIVKQFHT